MKRFKGFLPVLLAMALMIWASTQFERASPVSSHESRDPGQEPPLRVEEPEAGDDEMEHAPLTTEASLAIPESDVLELELRREPGRAPRSMMRFANELSPQMEKALISSQAALRLFPQLVDCALLPEETSIESLRGFCALNARRLYARHPLLLGAEWRKVTAQASEPTRALIQAAAGSAF